MFLIDDMEAKLDFIDAFNRGEIIEEEKNFLYQGEPTEFKITLDRENYGNTRLIYGKDNSQEIVNISFHKGDIHTFYADGTSASEKFKPYICTPRSAPGAIRLKGNNHYNYIKEYDSLNDIQRLRPTIWEQKLFYMANPVEAHMLRSGKTYYKGMKPEQLRLLSFDIETSGLNPTASNARVFLITNTLRTETGELQRKTFNIDNFADEGTMIAAWCDWCVQVDPWCILGHNIYSFDLPYLRARASVFNRELTLGKGGIALAFEDRPREKRKDGSQSYTYYRPTCFGRDLLDTFFLAITADSARKFTSYGLKNLVRELGLEKEGRTFIAAGKIAQHWNDPELKSKIISYAEEDSDDSIKLYDKFATSFFYFTQHIPKPFQLMTESATGGQINAFLLRGYLQDGYAFPKTTETEGVTVEGGISFAVPGIYDNVLKVDLKSCYPSQILRFKLYDKKKDPFAFYYRMVHYFTYKRFEYKKLGQETGDSYYKEMDAVSKIFINSSYGLMNTPGLHFNNPEIASKITKESREVIDMSLRWASGKSTQHWFEQFHEKTGVKSEDRKHPTILNELPVTKCHDFIIGPTDTDSISFCKKDGHAFTEQEADQLLQELNSISPHMMVWEDDGRYDKIVALKAKNYILKKGDDVKFKGSAILDQKKEKALQEMLREMCNDLMDTKGKNLTAIYEKYIREAKNPTDITRWAQKKTLTKPILKCATDPTARANERVVWEAVKDKGLSEGDKFYVYHAILDRQVEVTESKVGKVKEKEILTHGQLCVEDWDGKNHAPDKLVKRVFDSVKVFSYIVDVDATFVNYSLKKNQEALWNL